MKGSEWEGEEERGMARVTKSDEGKEEREEKKRIEAFPDAARRCKDAGKGGRAREMKKVGDEEELLGWAV